MVTYHVENGHNLGICLIFFCIYTKALLKRKDRSNNNLQHLTKKKKYRKSYFTSSIRLIPRSHQGLNIFKSCLVKHSLKLFPFIKAALGFLSTTDLVRMKG